MRFLRLITVVGLALGLVGLDGARPTSAAAQEAPPTVGIIGDSIPFQADVDTVGGLDATVGLDRQITYEYLRLGLNIDDVLPLTRAALQGANRPDIFLVFIGTHQSQFEPPEEWRRDLRRLLDAVSPRVECIRVFEIDDDDTGFYSLHDRNGAAYNRITRQLTAEYDNAEWYHYSRWADLAGPEFERPDILHHNASGSLALARLIRRVANSCDPALTSGPFWDVPDAHPAAEAIAWLGEQGLFRGYTNHTYRAEIGPWVIPAHRWDLVNMTWKLEGRPGPYPHHGWSDGGPRLDPILRWVHGEALLPGLPDGTFRPHRPISRSQAIHFLWRLADPPDEPTGDPWTDVNGPAYRWAAANRLLGGSVGDEFRPTDDLSRAQMAGLLFRFAALPPGRQPAAG
jgi:hypothetical protein